MARRAITGALVIAVVAAAVTVAVLAHGSASPPDGLHVVSSKQGVPQLEDGRGRTVLLRGVAVTALIQYAPDYDENPPVSDGDFSEIAALGFDFVRLPVSWSRIEPRPGSFDGRYLRQVKGTVRAAERHGLYVLLDMHLDRYSRGLTPGQEADGAPAWATLVPSTCPALPGPDDCTRAAWQSFWDNREADGTGLQRHYINALLALARTAKGQPDLAGIELMNNPSSGGLRPAAFERQELWPFYRRAIAALRGAGEQAPLWIDRAASSETTDALPAGGPGRLSSDSNLVLAPHDYAGVFSGPLWPAGGEGPLAQWYAAARGQAGAQHMALVVSEWGAPAGGPWEALLGTKLRLQNALPVGSAFWMWKQRPGFYNWYLVNPDGGLRSDSSRAQVLSRAHPDAVPGRLLGFVSGAGSLTVRLNGAGGTASLWSGAQVGSERALTHAWLDGRPVPAALAARRFSSAAIAVSGYVVSVKVPPGRHTLVLR